MKSLLSPNKIKKNINAQIISVFTALMLIIIVLITFVSIYHQKRVLSNELEKRGDLLLTTLSNACRLGVYSENISLLQSPVVGALENKGVTAIDVYNNSWKKIIRRNKESHNPSVVDQTILRNIQKTLLEKNELTINKNDTIEFWGIIRAKDEYGLGNEPFFERSNIDLPDNTIGYISIVMDKVLFKEQIRRIVAQNIFIGAIVWLIGLWMAYKSTKTVTLPVKELISAVKNIESRGFGDQVKVHTKNEIGQLAEAFNHMSLTLSKRESEKKQLEQQVWQINSKRAIETIKLEIGNDLGAALLRRPMSTG